MATSTQIDSHNVKDGDSPDNAMQIMLQGVPSTAFNAIAYNGSQVMGFYGVIAGGDGATVSYKFPLQAGTYQFNVYGSKALSRGIVDWSIDGVDFETGQDWYVSGQTFNDDFETTGVEVIGDGLHEVIFTVNGKNASSSNYLVSHTFFTFIRTGA